MTIVLISIVQQAINIVIQNIFIFVAGFGTIMERKKPKKIYKKIKSIMLVLYCTILIVASVLYTYELKKFNNLVSVQSTLYSTSIVLDNTHTYATVSEVNSLTSTINTYLNTEITTYKTYSNVESRLCEDQLTLVSEVVNKYNEKQKTLDNTYLTYNTDELSPLVSTLEILQILIPCFSVVVCFTLIILTDKKWILVLVCTFFVLFFLANMFMEIIVSIYSNIVQKPYKDVLQLLKFPTYIETNELCQNQLISGLNLNGTIFETNYTITSTIGFIQHQSDLSSNTNFKTLVSTTVTGLQTILSNYNSLQLQTNETIHCTTSWDETNLENYFVVFGFWYYLVSVINYLSAFLVSSIIFSSLSSLFTKSKDEDDYTVHININGGGEEVSLVKKGKYVFNIQTNVQTN
jgi:hypothetical protein